jgi:hypothetical protein
MAYHSFDRFSKASVSTIGMICLFASSPAQANDSAGLAALAKLEAKAKAGVTAEYSIVIDGQEERIFGRLYFKDKKLRVDQISYRIGSKWLIDPVVLVQVSDFSKQNSKPETTSSTFSYPKDFQTPQEILNLVRDKAHPRSSFLKNAPAPAFTPLLRRYGWESNGWISKAIKSSGDFLSTENGKKVSLSWIAGGQVRRTLNLKTDDAVSVLSLTSKPLNPEEGSFKSFSFLKKSYGEGVYAMRSEQDYSSMPEEVRVQAIKDLELGPDAKAVFSETITLESEAFGPLDDKLFMLEPHEDSMITDYQSGSISRNIDGKRQTVGNINDKKGDPYNSSILLFSFGAATLIGTAGAAVAVKRRKGLDSHK